jgi:hypothetical protein
MQMSFLEESRRLCNRRMKRELGLMLEYPTPQALLDRIAPSASARQGRLL